MEARLRREVGEALAALVAAGTLATVPGERYVWGAAALELLPPTCIGERRWDGEAWELRTPEQRVQVAE